MKRKKEHGKGNAMFLLSFPGRIAGCYCFSRASYKAVRARACP